MLGKGHLWRGFLYTGAFICFRNRRNFEKQPRTRVSLLIKPGLGHSDLMDGSAQYLVLVFK